MVLSDTVLKSLSFNRDITTAFPEFLSIVFKTCASCKKKQTSVSSLNSLKTKIANYSSVKANKLKQLLKTDSIVVTYSINGVLHTKEL